MSDADQKKLLQLIRMKEEMVSLSGAIQGQQL